MSMKSRSSTNTRIIRKRNLGGVGGGGRKTHTYIHTYEEAQWRFDINDDSTRGKQVCEE